MIIDTPGMKFYSIYCIDEAKTYQIHSKTVPTMCPNDHSIDTTQTVEICDIPNMKVYTQILTPRTTNVNAKNFQNINCEFYYNKFYMTEIINIEIISNINSSSDYDVKMFNNTEVSEVLNKTLNNTEKKPNKLNTSNISFDKNSILEFQTRLSGKGNVANKNINVDAIVIQYT